eukprot:13934962-Ditylum_brightwellii.AAC.1
MMDSQSTSTEATGAAAVAQDTAGTPCPTPVIGSKRPKKTSTEELVPVLRSNPPRRGDKASPNCAVTAP